MWLFYVIFYVCFFTLDLCVYLLMFWFDSLHLFSSSPLDDKFLYPDWVTVTPTKICTSTPSLGRQHKSLGSVTGSGISVLRLVLDLCVSVLHMFESCFISVQVLYSFLLAFVVFLLKIFACISLLFHWLSLFPSHKRASCFVWWQPHPSSHCCSY